MAVALACFEIGLKEAPQAGWFSTVGVCLLGCAVLAGWLFVERSMRRTEPHGRFARLRRPRFALGCLLSFLLGISLYGMVYLMPVFLAFVRGHDAYEIGQILVVTGLAQLLMAPLVVAARRDSRRALTAIGFAAVCRGPRHEHGADARNRFRRDAGAAARARRGNHALPAAAHPGCAWASAPQDVANASGLFNLMRNLGGAIGLALIDTVIYGRAPIIGDRLGQALERGDVAAAKAVGLPMERFLAHVPGTPVDPGLVGYIRAAVERQAMTEAINEAWAIMMALTLLGALIMLAVLASERSA